MKHFTQSSPSSKSTDFDNNLTPIQAAAAIALGFGLEIPAVAAELKIHRSTLYNWAKNPLFFKSVETAQAQFEKQFRTQIAMLTRLALTNIQQILADTEASPSVRLKAALAVLKQDWKLPNSTEFDTNSQESDPLRNEMPPESPEPPQPIRSEKIGRNEPCPCGSSLKYKRCCGNPLHGHSTNFDNASSMESTACETK
ncbi:MAG: SEC-C domain-containing protein [Bryobacterales bacterium]|nr:SEC-C domain-containing protein [Bryobacterales bacterium]